MTDAELLVAIGEGRADALRELHERHAPWLAARLSHCSGDRGMVDEAIQDTFVSTTTEFSPSTSIQLPDGVQTIVMVAYFLTTSFV